MSDFLKKDGAQITIVFTYPLMELIGGEENHFKVYIEEYKYVPGGEVIYTEKKVKSVVKTNSDTLILNMVPTQRFCACIGRIQVDYDGEGQIYGEDGKVESFSKIFEPDGLEWKGHVRPLYEEHSSLKEIESDMRLTKIRYYNVKNSTDVSGIVDIEPQLILTNIHDI